MNIFYKFLKLVKWILIIYFSLYSLLFLYLLFGSSIFYSKSEIKNRIAEIEHAKVLTPTFYNIYDKLYSDRKNNLIKIYWIETWRTPFYNTHKTSNSFCLKAARISNKFENRSVFAIASLAIKLQSSVGAEKCFDYTMANEYEHYKTIFHTNSNLEELKDTTQILQFFIAKKGPSVYIHKPALLKTKLLEMKQQLLN